MAKMKRNVQSTSLAIVLWAVLFLFISAFKAPLPAGMQDYDILVIINGELGIDSISIEDLNRIYLGKKRNLGGKNITRLASLESGVTHQQFLSNCLNRSHSSFINYWKRMVFTGKGVMPSVFRDEEALVEYVRRNKSAIGYISSDTPYDGVTAIKITR